MHYYYCDLSPCCPVKGNRCRVQNYYIITSATSDSELELEPSETQSPSKGLLLRTTVVYHQQQQQQRSNHHHHQHHQRRIEYKCTNRLVGCCLYSLRIIIIVDGQLEIVQRRPRICCPLLTVSHGRLSWQTPTPTQE